MGLAQEMKNIMEISRITTIEQQYAKALIDIEEAAKDCRSSLIITFPFRSRSMTNNLMDRLTDEGFEVKLVSVDNLEYRLGVAWR